MFPLKLQIQVACVQVNDAITIFTNAGDVVRPGACTDTTLEDLKARLSATLANVASATPESFDGAETRAVDMPLFGTTQPGHRRPEHAARLDLSTSTSR